MNNSMISAMVSMNALQRKLDVIADNIANIDTDGYKRKESSFEDVLTTVTQQPDGFKQNGRVSALGYTNGFGMRMTEITRDMQQGPLNQTGNPMDLAIEGTGLFAVEAGGRTAYTREGAFHFVPDPDPAKPDNMVLVNNQGYFVLDADGKQISVANDAKVAFDKDGRLMVSDATGTTAVTTIQLASPVRPDALVQMDGNLFVIPANLTKAQVFGNAPYTAAASGTTIRSGYLEQSNVDYAQEITDMMQAQRAYQLSARALTSSDTMMNLANNIRG
ncbi:flagellar hook-basal body protein [Paenibacillus sp. XY044]|uniref:flagellar hook-basal body protein n=1 Tax=Paenibacillus sp. XY044 TaxID=2026089 RepID=UPI000B988110|nr:flagellar hook-basal body protein [Paenibacillus sp. XY044]OZB93365.1 flagellar biosynthesis protein FlgG [Paenibacillus sp. XY044]